MQKLIGALKGIIPPFEEFCEEVLDQDRINLCCGCPLLIATGM